MNVCNIFQSIPVGQTSQRNTKSFYSINYNTITAHNVIGNSQSTVKPVLVTTSIMQKLVLCYVNLYLPSQCISYQLNLY